MTFSSFQGFHSNHLLSVRASKVVPAKAVDLAPRLQPEVQSPAVQPRLPVRQLAQERGPGVEAETGVVEGDERPRVYRPTRRHRR